jgi:hypothetical protein
MLRGAWYILFAACAFWPLASGILAHMTVSPDEQARLASRFIFPTECRPEPGERTAYLAGLVVLPLLLFGLALAGRRLQTDGWLRVPAAVSWTVELAVGTLLLVLAWRCLRAESYFPLMRNQFFLHPRISLALSAVGLILLGCLRFDSGWPARMAAVLAAGLVGLVFLAHVFDEHAVYASHVHFIPVYNAMVQVQQGKAILIDMVSQYGLYPHFLTPIFALVGLSVLKFTVVLGLLTALSFGALWVVLREAIPRQSVACLGFLSLIFNCWLFFLFISTTDTRTYLELYFQYFPIRLLFPALAVLLTWRYGHRPSRRLYGGAMILLAAGILWNLDAGVPAFGAWLGALCYTELFAEGWRDRAVGVVRHLAAGGLALLGVLAAHSAFTVVRHGSLPHYGEFLAYQKLFYFSGFFMLPMPFPGTWLLVVLVYLAGLTYAAVALAERRNTARAKLVLALSILGAGLFAYYQGRSHPIVLTVACWPCFPLLVIFLDEVLDYWPGWGLRPLPLVTAALLVWVLLGSSISVFSHVDFVGRAIQTQLRLAFGKTPSVVAEEAALLKKEIPRGEAVLVWSKWEPILHRSARRPTVARCSLVEMVVLEEYQRLRRTLEARPAVRVYVAKDVLGQQTWPWSNEGVRLVLQLLREQYQVVGETPNGCLFRRKCDEPSRAEIFRW